MHQLNYLIEFYPKYLIHHNSAHQHNNQSMQLTSSIQNINTNIRR